MYYRIRFFLVFILVFAGAAFPALAGDIIELRSTDSDNADEFPIGLERLHIDIDQLAGTYQVTLEAEILNGNSDAQTEVEFLLPMPKGAIINDYALDIQGELIDGVLTEKERARKTYTDKVTRTIDPGIAERASDNRYKTRIFPVPPGETRTIRLGFVVEVTEDFEWQVKTDIRAKDVRLGGNGLPARLSDNPAYRQNGDSYEANHHRINQSFAFKTHPDISTVIATHAEGGNFLITQLDDDERAQLNQGQDAPEKIAIIWDTSLSRAGDRHSAERKVISDWLEDAAPASIRVIMGADKVDYDKSYRDSDPIADLFDDLDYDGGSDLNGLLDFKGRYDRCILVSDGHMTVGRGQMQRPDCPVYVVTSSSDPNLPFLSSLAVRSGGQVISDLSSRRAAIARLSATAGLAITDTNLDMPVLLGDKLVARVPAGVRDAKIQLQSATGRDLTIRRDTGRLERIAHNGPGTVWASYKTEAMRAEGASAKEVIEFSRTFSIAGPESTLIVLEAPWDYINADIPVPDNYPKALRGQYEEALADHLAERDSEIEARQSTMRTIWTQQVAWWNKDYKYDPEAKTADTEQRVVPSVTRMENRRETAWDGTEVVEGEAMPSPAPPPPPPPQMMTLPDGSTVTSQDVASGYSSESLDEIVVTGSRNVRNDFESQSPAANSTNDITVKVRKWSPDRPYLNKLQEAEADEQDAVYRKKKERYGDLPAFYLEVADFYAAQDQKTRAAEIVLGALELPAANTETITQVAHRLLSYGEYDRAIELYRYSLELAPNLPQSYLNLAVALHDLGLEAGGSDAQTHYLEALSLLEHIIVTPWSFENARVYDGVEIVAMTEANGIIPHLSSSSRRKLSFPEELVQNLDLDSRVVMDWNIDHADMDLAVIEPTGEKASYQNKLTRIGGQLSDDMTDGYGPEQYVLRNAYAGAYEVQTTFYSASEYNPNGAVSVRVRMTQNFGRSNQSTETVIVELKEQKDKISVGEFVVK